MADGFSLRRGGWARPFASVFKDGDLFAGRYRILRTAAHGGMGRIYQAEDEGSGRMVALKVVTIPKMDRTLLERFQREARILHRLEHANLVRAFESGETEEGLLYLALEWLEGCDLGERLATGPIPLPEAFGIVTGALRGLSAAHQAGVVHRDIKPGNIYLLGGLPPPRGVKLLDFGVAKLFEEALKAEGETSLTLDGMVVGTPFYMAPEQAQGRDDLDHRSDLFSLGSVLYECACGRRPFEGSSPLTLLVRIAYESPCPIREIDPNLPEALEKFLIHALAREPSERFQSAGEMELALSAIGTSSAEEPPTMSNLLVAEPSPSTDRAEPLSPNFGDDLETLRPDDQIAKELLEIREEQNVASLMGRPALAGVDSLLDGRAPNTSAVGERRLVTVVVADLSSVGAQKRLAWAVLQRALTGFGGDALPVKGGLAIGVFGSKESTGDEPIRAVRAALRAIGRGGREEPESGGVGELRIAVGTGTVIRSKGDVSGEAIESACALLTLAEPGEVIVDRETYDRSGPKIVGRPRSANAYTVTSARSGSSLRLHQMSKSISAPFVGRDEQLKSLLRSFDVSLRGKHCRVALVHGAPGIGKTRLREELRRQIQRHAVRTNVILGRAEHSSEAAPLAIFADALRRRGSIHGGEQMATLVAKLEGLVPRSVDPVIRERAMSAVAKLVGLSVDEGSTPTDPEPTAPSSHDRALSERLRRSLVSVLKAHAKEGPVALLLEDIQWADPASLGVIHELAASKEPLQLFVLMTSRPEFLETQADFLADLVATGHFHSVELGPLSSADLRTCTESMLARRIDEDLVEDLLARTGGNPFVLEETVRALLKADERPLDSALPTLPPRSAEILDRLEALPSNVHAMIQARVDQLSPPEKKLLKRAAVFGNTFWDQGLQAMQVETNQELFDSLAGADFIALQDSSRFSGAREYGFKSSMLRDVVYSLLHEEQRPALHQAAAEWLEKVGESDPMILAQHLVPAGQPDRARGALLAGAKKAVAGGDTSGSMRIAEEALKITGGKYEGQNRVDLLLVCQDAQLLSGTYSDALKTLEIIASLKEGSQIDPWLDSRRGAIHLRRGDPVAALRFFREAERKFAIADKPVEAGFAAIGIGDALEDRGETVAACDYYEQAYAASKQRNDARLGASGILRLGRMAYATADLGQAARLFERARTRFSGVLEDPHGEATARLWLGASLWMAGAVGAGVEHLSAARDRFDAMPDVQLALQAEAYLGAALFDLGQHNESDRLLEATFRRAHSTELRPAALLCGIYRVRGLLAADRNQEARALAEELSAVAVRSLPRFMVPLESALGLALARCSEPKTGVEHTTSALHRLEAQQACEDEDPQRIYAQHAEALELAGHRDESRAVWRRAIETLREVESRLDDAQKPDFRARPINQTILGRAS